MKAAAIIFTFCFLQHGPSTELVSLQIYNFKAQSHGLFADKEVNLPFACKPFSQASFNRLLFISFFKQPQDLLLPFAKLLLSTLDINPHSHLHQYVIRWSLLGARIKTSQRPIFLPAKHFFSLYHLFFLGFLSP